MPATLVFWIKIVTAKLIFSFLVCSVPVGWMMVFLLSFITPALCNESQAINRWNYGVTYIPQGIISATNDYWQHTFELPLPPATFPHIKSPTCVDTSNDCSLVDSLLVQIQDIQRESRITLSSIRSQIISLVPYMSLPDSTSRSKRSLLPFIGQLSKSLFGTASMGDIQLLASKILALKQRQDGILSNAQQFSGHLASYVQSTNDRIDGITEGMKENHIAIENLEKIHCRRQIKGHEPIYYTKFLPQQTDASSFYT